MQVDRTFEGSFTFFCASFGLVKYLKVKIDGLPIPKGWLVKGQYKII